MLKFQHLEKISMQAYLAVLRQCALFGGLSDAQILESLRQLRAKKRRFQKEEIILAEGAPADLFGVVLCGQVSVSKYDQFGNKNIFATLHPCGLFAESFAFSDAPVMSVEVCAASECTVLLIKAEDFFRHAAHCAPLLRNALGAIANKNLAFDQRIEIVSKRRTRDKLLAFLSIQKQLQNSSTVRIEYSRQELADYLGVDRSGLSAEIGRLVRQGVFSCSGREFTLQ